MELYIVACCFEATDIAYRLQPNERAVVFLARGDRDRTVVRAVWRMA